MTRKTRLAAACVLAVFMLSTGCATIPEKPQRFTRTDCVSAYETIQKGKNTRAAGIASVIIGPLLLGGGLLQLMLGGDESSAVAGIIVGGGATIASPFILGGSEAQLNRGIGAWNASGCPENP